MCRARGGFTLVELLVTLVILAVLAAVAVPAFLSDRSPPDLEEASGRVEALLRMARDSAIASGTRVTVVVDSVSGLVWIDGEPGVGAPVAASATLQRPGVVEGLSAPRGESLELPRAIQLEITRARALFTFGPGGDAVGDSIRLRASTGEVRLITLNPWTGHVVTH